MPFTTAASQVPTDPHGAYSTWRRRLYDEVTHASSSRAQRLRSRPGRLLYVRLWRLLSRFNHGLAPTRLFTGQLFLVPSKDLSTLVHGFYEPDLSELLLDIIRPGMTIIDVGANIGYFSVVCSRLVGGGGHVVAVEPTPRTQQILRRNVARLANVVVEGFAAYSNAGTVELLDFGPSLAGNNTVMERGRFSASTSARLKPTRMQVTAQSLDNYCAGHDLHPDFVKIDAEGAEGEILKGMKRVLSEDSPIVAVETEPDPDSDSQVTNPILAAILAESGYVPVVMTSTLPKGLMTVFHRPGA